MVIFHSYVKFPEGKATRALLSWFPRGNWSKLSIGSYWFNRSQQRIWTWISTLGMFQNISGLYQSWILGRPWEVIYVRGNTTNKQALSTHSYAYKPCKMCVHDWFWIVTGSKPVNSQTSNPPVIYHSQFFHGLWYIYIYMIDLLVYTWYKWSSHRWTPNIYCTRYIGWTSPYVWRLSHVESPFLYMNIWYPKNIPKSSHMELVVYVSCEHV